MSMQPINEKPPLGDNPTLAYPPPTQSQPVYPGQVPSGPGPQPYGSAVAPGQPPQPVYPGQVTGGPGPQPYGAAVAPGQPPQPGYGGAPGIVSTTNNVTVVSQAAPARTGAVIITQPVHNARAGPRAMVMTCPNCHHTGMTIPEKKCGPMPWVSCAGVCAAGCVFCGLTWFGCCLIPFCMNDLYDHTHICANCQNVIAYHKFFS